MKKPNSISWWSEDKSFYFVLMLCLLAAAAAAYILFVSPAPLEEADPMDGYLYEADDSVTASAEPERIPAMQAEVPTEPEEEEESEPKPPVEEAVESAAPLVFAPPMGTEVTRAFSDDILEYDETTEDWRTHPAVDFAGEQGDPVYAIADGTVLTVGEDAIYGTYVVLAHAQDMTSLYAGLQEVTVSEGDSISGGTQFAALGEPMPLEEKQGIHLHLSVIQKQESINPQKLF